MKINLRVNQKEHVLDIQPGETLLNVLRGVGYYGVKHGCESGECGACAVLLDGRAGQFLFAAGGTGGRACA